MIIGISALHVARTCYDPGMLPWLVLTAAGVAVLLVAEAARLRPLTLVSKPLASTGFVGLAVTAGAQGHRYGAIVLVALALSWVGDVCLLARTSKRLFLAGLGAFLLGHVAYVIAFIQLGPAWRPAAAALAVLLVPAVLVGRWLDPHLSGSMRAPVRAYIAVITCMLATAVGAFAGNAHMLVLVSAFGFYLSDLAVARERFVHASLVNRLWGLPLYYAAQLCLAWTAGP